MSQGYHQLLVALVVMSVVVSADYCNQLIGGGMIEIPTHQGDHLLRLFYQGRPQ